MTGLVVFDLDGTLIDSRRDLATAANVLVTEYGGQPFSEEEVGNMVGEGAAVLVRRALTAAGFPGDLPGAVERFLELYDRVLLDTTRPYPGIVDTLSSLSRRLPLAVLTNKPQRATARLLDGLDLQRYFASAIGGDSPFGRKPDPAGLLHLSTHFEVTPAATLMVGDSPIDLDTARRAGAQICLVRFGFGYRPVELRAGERAVDSPEALANLF